MVYMVGLEAAGGDIDLIVTEEELDSGDWRMTEKCGAAMP